MTSVFFSGICPGIPTCPDYWLFIHSKIERNLCECRKTKYASCHGVRNFSTSLECLSLFKVFQHRISSWSNANFHNGRILLPVPSAVHQIPIKYLLGVVYHLNKVYKLSGSFNCLLY